MKKKNKKNENTGRFWEDLPIREATHELRVFATKEDIDGATAKDWSKCVFARACARLYGSRRVAFFRSVAYVELPAEDGSRVVERFHMTQPLREKIEQFDKTHVCPSGGFLLTAMRPSYTLAAKAAKSTRQRIKRRAAAIKGNKAKPFRNPDPIVLDWRSGTGMVHFNSKTPIIQPTGRDHKGAKGVMDKAASNP